MNSGIGLEDSLNKAGGVLEKIDKAEIAGLIFKIEKVKNVQKIVLHKSFEPHADKLHGYYGPLYWKMFSDACQELPICYGCHYISFKTKEGISARKLVFMYWCTEDAKVNDKMVYSSSKDTLTKKVKSINIKLQGDSADELSYKEIAKQVSKGDIDLNASADAI